MDKTDRLRDYGLAFLLYEQGLGICGYELIRELFIFVKLILNCYLRIYPVKAGLNDHCGMFFLDKDKKVICDDLTIRPYTLKTLRSLCDLLQANVVFANC